MKIYISSSWKNRDKVRETAIKLRNMGHEVYDFTDPSCRKTPEIPPENFPEEFDPEVHVYSQYIQRPEWYSAVTENKEAIKWADLIILILPCGNDAHADWAYGVGLGKRSAVVGTPKKGDRSPVHMWADAITDSWDELFGYVEMLQNSAALRTAQEREKPEPLTYEEYEALAEETCVFVVDGDGRTANALINSDGDCIDSDAGLWEQTYYGLKGDGYLGLHSVGWLAYHSRPEEGERG